MKKKLILLNESGLNDIFTRAFINEGYDVISILQEPFIYKKGLWEKLMNIFHRIFFKDNGYLKRDYYTQLNKEVYRRIKKITSPIDYTVIFRADYYSKKNIKLLRKKSKKLITYQYDGWKLGSSIVRYKSYFDRIFFFDKDDLPRYGNGALPLSNCYFIDNNEQVTTEFDIFYLGTGTSTRIQQIKNLYDRFSDRLKIKAIIKIPHYQEERKMGGGTVLS